LKEIGCKSAWPVPVSPLFWSFLVNRTTIDLQNRQTGQAGMGSFIAQLAKSVLAQPNSRFDSSSPTGC